MKTKKLLITGLYWLFIAGFVGQILAIGSYFTITLYNSSSGAVFVESDVRVFSDSSWKYQIPGVDKDTSIRASVYKLPFARSVIHYDKYERLSTKAWVIVMLNLSGYVIWLLFTWQLLQVFRSLKQSQIFEKKNVWRLRLVALFVGIAPFLELLRNIIYPSLFAENAVLTNHRIAYYYDESILQGFFYMIVILLVVEIFKYGISLKEDQDLTI